MRYSGALFLSFFSIAALCNDETTGRVTDVIDGNTITIKTSDEEYTVVLADIDSPELNQSYGDEAKRFLEKIVLKKEVVVQFTGKDRKGNHLAIILIKGKVDARVELLKEGLAWTSERNPKPELEAHRNEAQEKGIGLWKDENPTPPWTFRREQSMLQPKSS